MNRSLRQREETVAARKRPKYANHKICEILNLDSAAFLYRDPTNNLAEPLYLISDRFSPFVEGEKPKATVSIIREKGRPYQLRIAVRGAFHIEKLSYYVKDPYYWVEWGWLIFPQYEIPHFRQILVQFIDPNTGLWELMR